MDLVPHRPVLRIVVVALCSVLIAIGGAGAASAAPAVPAVSTKSPVPPGAYGWTDCGKYTCTFYFTRSATRTVNTYFKNTHVNVGILTNVLCGVVGYFIAKSPGLLAGLACSGVTNRLDWPSKAADAVKANGCFQLAYPNRGGRKPGLADMTPGWTTHPAYCFN